MLAAIVAVVTAALALVRGGSLESLAATKFRWIWLLVAGLIAQIAFDVWSPDWLSGGAALAVLLTTNLAVLTFLAVNPRVPGLALAAVGLVLNVAVISANGAMPVSADALETAGFERTALEDVGIKHERLGDDTVAPWLADVIPIPGVKQVISAGDVVLALGIGRLVYVRSMAGRRQQAALR